MKKWAYPQENLIEPWLKKGNCNRFTQIQHAWGRLWSLGHSLIFLSTQLDYISQTSLQLDVGMWLSFSQWNVPRAVSATSKLDHKNSIIHVLSSSSGFRRMDMVTLKATHKFCYLNKITGAWVPESPLRGELLTNQVLFAFYLWEK